MDDEQIAELKKIHAQIEADRRDWAAERIQAETLRGAQALRDARIQSAERDAERLKLNERQAWVLAGRPGAEFDAQWPARRAELAAEMVDGKRERPQPAGRVGVVARLF